MNRILALAALTLILATSLVWGQHISSAVAGHGDLEILGGARAGHGDLEILDGARAGHGDLEILGGARAGHGDLEIIRA